MTVRKFDARSEECKRSAVRAVVALGVMAALPLGGLHTARAADATAPHETENGTVSAASPSEDQRRVLAKAKYEQGVEAYRAEHYADAVRSFLEADALSPSAALSYNIARAYEKLADDAQTLRWYRNYLRLDPHAKNQSEVQRYIQRLSAALAKNGIQQVTVLSTPSGATVAIDGSPVGVTPLTAELAPGAHVAVLSKRGFSDAPTDFTLSANDPLDVAVSLQPAPIAATAKAPEHHSGKRFGIAPYVTLGVAAACLGAAGIFEISRRSAQNSAKAETVQLAFEQDVQDMHTRETAARVLLGVGSALAVAGGALLVFNTPVSSESRAVVASVPGGATLRIESSF